MKYKRTLILIAVIIGFLIIALTTYAMPSESGEVRDLSNITLPSYSLPKGSLTKGQAVKLALNMSKAFLKHKQIPKNPQCILIPYEEAEKLLLNVNPDALLRSKFSSKLIYVVTIDVDRTAPQEVMGWRPGAKPVTFHQDSYFIDPATGEVIEYGYEGIKWILPKQNSTP